MFFKDVTAQDREIDNLYNNFGKLEFYKAISSKSSEAVFVINNENLIEYWDDCSEKLFEVSKEEAIGVLARNVISILSDNFLDTLRLKLNDKDIYKIALSYLDKNREKKTYESYFAFLDEKRNQIIVKCTDITDKIHFEEGLKSSLKSLREILIKSPSLICNIDPDGQVFFVNSSIQAVLELSDEELLAKNF